MTVLRALCSVGLHPRRGWQFVGSGWHPNLYVRVCLECGREMPDPDHTDGSEA